MPKKLLKWELKKNFIILVKKQKDNLKNLLALFENKEQLISHMKTLIIDDKADYASIGYNIKNGQMSVNLTAFELDRLRKAVKEVSFLQVTATPSALYLQPESINIMGIKFKPVRPISTVLVPVNKGYIGSDFYFGSTNDRASLAYYLHCSVEERELKTLIPKTPQPLRLDHVLNSENITSLRQAFTNFLVGGAIRQLKNIVDRKPIRKFSFLVHASVQKRSHEWQRKVIEAIHSELVKESATDPEVFNNIISTSYRNIACSIEINNDFLPTYEEVKCLLRAVFFEEQVLILSINSEIQIDSILDYKGHLKLRAPFNVFIGGQILDRGITINNLIAFYYARRPKSFQQDTVLQHCRMFGYRSQEDLAATRFYTGQAIYTAMKKMHESDTALREQFVKNPEQGVSFIVGSRTGMIRLCSPNKIMLSQTTTLTPNKRLLPIGFQTKNRATTNRITKKIDELLAPFCHGGFLPSSFLLKMTTALDIIDLARQAILMNESEGYFFDWNCMKNGIEYMANKSSTPDRILCFYQQYSNNKRIIGDGLHAKYLATLDIRPDHIDQADKLDPDTPRLALFREQGSKVKGWCWAPFYWPLLHAAENTPVTIYVDEASIVSDSQDICCNTG